MCKWVCLCVCLCARICVTSVFNSHTLYLEVHRLHLVSECVGLAHQLQHWSHLVGVVQTLHQCVDGIHDSASVLPELGAPLQLLRLLDVLELAEILLGRGEVHKQPVKEDSFCQMRDTSVSSCCEAPLISAPFSLPAPAPSCEPMFFFFFFQLAKYHK